MLGHLFQEQPHQTSRTQSSDPPKAKHTKTSVPKHWSANVNLDKYRVGLAGRCQPTLKKLTCSTSDLPNNNIFGCLMKEHNGWQQQTRFICKDWALSVSPSLVRNGLTFYAIGDPDPWHWSTHLLDISLRPLIWSPLTYYTKYYTRSYTKYYTKSYTKYYTKYYTKFPTLRTTLSTTLNSRH